MKKAFLILSEGSLAVLRRSVLGGLVLAVAALGCCAGCKVPQSRPSVGNMLASPDPLVRHQANEELIQMGPRAVALLEREILYTDKPEVRREALLALGRVGRWGRNAAEPAARALAGLLLLGPQPEIKTLSIAALRYIGPPAIPALADTLAKTDISMRDPRQPTPTVDIAAVMVEIDRRAAIDSLIKMLTSPQYEKYQANVVAHLSLMTQQTFGYQESAPPAERKKAVEAFVRWWQEKSREEGLE